jgi:hypothetical protein
MAQALCAHPRRRIAGRRRRSRAKPTLASEEIAEIIEVKLGTVRSRLRDGRKELLALLQDDPYFGEEAR